MGYRPVAVAEPPRTFDCERIMAGPIRRRHEAVDYAAIERMFPPPPEYFETAWFDPPEVIERRQLARLKERALTTYGKLVWGLPVHQDPMV